MQSQLDLQVRMNEKIGVLKIHKRPGIVTECPGNDYLMTSCQQSLKKPVSIYLFPSNIEVRRVHSKKERPLDSMAAF